MGKNHRWCKKMRFRNFLIFFILIIPMFLFSHKTTVYISDFGNPSLKETITFNSSKFLTNINTSYFDNSELILDHIQITNAGEKIIKSLWNNRKFYCTETEIIQNLIKRTNGNYFKF